ncbi:MAG TPA: alpha/beta hydrolase fold domain-containing protein, partial [Solirubrobacterales bacterium]|nr:alpha/beta hydrolase fold domain-containing protein [Solirubrobacterales bacterium]
LLVWAGPERLAGDLAQRSGWALAAVDYRFGSDQLFPAALSDVYRCLAHFAAPGDRPAVAVGGSGFGGGLAAAAALLARRYGDPPPAAQVLLAPLLDMRLASPSWERYAGPAERQQLDAEIADHAPGVDRTDPLLSPLYAEDFSALPDAVIVTAGADPRRDDGERYAQLLNEAGVVVWGHRYPGLAHADACAGAAAAEGEVVVDGLASALRLVLSKATQSPPLSSSQRADASRSDRA